MSEMLCLMAHVAGSGILFDADAVDSVVDLGEIVPAPGAPPAVRGLAALRSRVVTVVDLREMLALPQATQAMSRAVVIRVEGHDYALLVDTLEDVARFSVTPPVAGIALGPRWSAVAGGMAERNGEALLVIDPERLIARIAPVN